MDETYSSPAAAGKEMSNLGHSLIAAAQDAHPEVAKKAVTHLANASADIAASAKAHGLNDHVAASLYLRKVAEGLTAGAKILAGAGSEDPEVLNTAHLGKAFGIHQNYVDAINEGKRNGR